MITIGEGSNGQNDYFVMDGLFRWPNTALTIYNRWGQTVYHADDYQNDWDGRNGNNGQLLPAGTYYYVVVYANGESETGHSLCSMINSMLFINQTSILTRYDLLSNTCLLLYICG